MGAHLLLAILLFGSVLSQITIPLTRFVDEDERLNLLTALAEQQTYPSLLETQDIPLSEHLMASRHLATYYGPITVKGVTFKVLFDTGSTEFWIPSDECATELCMKHNRYPVTGNEKKMSHGLIIQYLSGKVQGDMVYETVNLGDFSVPHQAVGLGKIIEIPLLERVVWDGIVGLGYPRSSTVATGIVPLFDTIITSQALKKKNLANQMAYYIDDEKGAITFGGVNCDLIGMPTDICMQQFVFVPISEPLYWTVVFKDIRIKYPGEKEISGLCPEGGCSSIVDTGTYLTYGPVNILSQMYRNPLRGCDVRSMPVIYFDFYVGDGDPPATVRLNPIDYILKYESDAHEECVMGISPDRRGRWTLGQTFLRSFYTVFDREFNRIGFARLPRTSFLSIGGKLNKQSANFRAIPKTNAFFEAPEESLMPNF